VAIKNGSGQTNTTGSLNLSNLSIPEGLVSMECKGGSYTDEATGKMVSSAPTLHAATIYSEADDLVLIVTPLSEIAYMLAGGSSNNNLADSINDKNILIAQAFGIKDVDIITTIPTDINLTIVQDDNAGKFGLILAAVSQMSENAGNAVSASSTSIIDALYADMADGNIDGIDGVDVITAINNFKNGTGDNNNTNGVGANNTGNAESATGEGSIMGDLAITKIDSYNNESNAPTLEDYINADVTGVTASNLLLVNDHMISYDVSTTDKIQTRVNVVIETTVSSIDKISNYDGTNDTPTLQDYDNADVTGVDAENLDYMNDKIASRISIEKDTTAKIQSVIDSVIVTSFSIDAIGNIDAPENEIFNSPVPSFTGYTIGAITYTMSGVDEQAFTIDSATGVVSMIHRNFENPDDVNADNVYEITITATDADGNNDDENIFVTITNETESANFVINPIHSIIIGENEAFTGTVPVLSGDTPHGTITYSLDGADATSFVIDTVTGVISMEGRDYDNPMDSNKDNVYEIFITATDSDNNNDSEEQSITISDVIEDAVFTIDNIVDVVVISNTAFTGVTPIISGDTPIGTLNYALSGVDYENFSIDNVTGVVSMIARDFDNPKDDNRDNDYEIVIIATDSNGNTASKEQLITVTFASIAIGTQIWSASNIELVPSAYNEVNIDYWKGSVYSKDGEGYYYTWNAAQNACPTGWRLPSDDDWKTLEGFLGLTTAEQDAFRWRGDADNAGTQLKEKGVTDFDAKLTGFYTAQSVFEGYNDIAYFWTSTKTATGDDAYRRNLSESEIGIYRDTISKSYGFNVRCVMN
jgi:uncharacterized protein (TIGR02145 family)